MYTAELNFFLHRYLDYFPFLIPLGIIGIWRWSVWIIKKSFGVFYKPVKAGFKDSVSIVTPVYNENPDTFLRALKSWTVNKPDEIIAVIDYSDKVCIKIFEEFSKKRPFAKLIITKIPGKREALATGIKIARSKIIALVDSDTLWDGQALIHGIAPFIDKNVGGVATRQNIETPKTLSQKLFSMRLEQRYWDDFPFLAQVGNQIVCLSGRTAFYRKEALLPIVNDMVNEKFMGEKVISGEDKRLTYLVEKNRWKTTYQSTSRVSTVGEKNLSIFLNQQIRWTRNSWRNDLKALYQGWVFRYPVFALYLIDRAIQPFTSMISPIYFVVSIYFKLWIPVVVIFIWWHLSRLIKMYPHLKKYPKDILLLQVYIIFNFISAYIRIYSLLSINTQGWITRWHQSRLKQRQFIYSSLPHMGTIFLFTLLLGVVYFHRYQTFILPRANQNQLVARTLPAKSNTVLTLNTSVPDVLGAQNSNLDKKYLTQKYEFQATDSLSTVAQKFDVPFDSLLQVNANKITNWNQISAGLVFTIPPKDYDLIPYSKFNYQRLYSDPLIISYDEGIDTIIVSGRGNIVNLTQIEQAVGSDYLTQTSPGNWFLKSNLYLRSGITLKLSKDEVKWLQMRSNSQKFVNILAYNSDVLIDGVKITSWNEEKEDFDRDLTNGRSFILIKDNSRMDLNNSEVAYLGYSRPKDSPYSTYGISWRMSQGNLGRYLLTGEVTNSKFHDNYFGLYTYGATGMTFRGNEFYANTRYGLDPHDDSNGFLVEDNVFHDNGTHGLIFSKRCINNTVRNNISYNNKLHGIMLHELSNNNLIENNKIYDNYDGISLDNSKNNILKNNLITNNKRGIVADKVSRENLIEKNIIKDNDQYGVYLYEQADSNIIINNQLIDNPTALYIKTSRNLALNNALDRNRVGIYFIGKATQNQLSNNKITYSNIYGIYTKISSGLTNLVEENNFIWRNHKDLAADSLE